MTHKIVVTIYFLISLMALIASIYSGNALLGIIWLGVTVWSGALAIAFWRK